MGTDTRRLLYALPYTIVAALTFVLLIYQFANYDKLGLSEHALSLFIAMCGCFVSVAGFTKLRNWIHEGRI